MANKEEVIFKVKAELEGFRKSMDELKKMAKESSKNIEKSMNLNLTDEGKKAGQTFAKGFNKEIKNLTDSLEKELKTMANQTYNVKIKLDSSSIEQVKKELSNIEVTVTASASSRASSSMNNNANAPNSASTIASMANAAVSSNIASEVKKAVDLITSAISKIDIAKIGVDTKDAKIGVDTDGVKVGIDSEGVKVGVDAQDVKVGVNAEGVKVGVDTQNIQDIKVGVDTKDAKVGVDTKDTKVGVDVKNAKVGVDTYDTKVGVDTRGAKVGVDTKNVKVDVNAKDIKIDANDIKVGVDVEGAKVGVDTKDVQIGIDKESIPEIELKAPEIKPIEINIESIKTVNDIITSAFKDGSEIIGTEIYNAFSKSAQELYGDIVELYKVIAQKISESNKSQNNNTTTSTKHKSNTLDDVKFGSYSWAEQERIKQRSPFEAPNERNPFVKTSDLGNKYALFEIDKIKNADKAFQDIQNTISDVSKSMKEMLKEFSESIKQISNTIKKAFVNDNHNQITKEDSKYARRGYAKNNTGASGELEKINKQIEQWSNRLNTLKTRLNNAMDDETVEKYSSAIDKAKEKLNALYKKLEEAKRLNGFDELCMTVEEANGAVSKLRMNLQLLADDSDEYAYVKNMPEFKDMVKRSIERDGEPMFGEYSDLSLSKVFKEDVESLYKEINDAIKQGSDVFDKCILMFQNKIGAMQNILHLLPTKGWSDTVNSNNQWSKDTLKQMERTVLAREKELLDPVEDLVYQFGDVETLVVEQAVVVEDATETFRKAYDKANKLIDSLPDESFKGAKELYRSYLQEGKEALEKEDLTSLSIRKENRLGENFLNTLKKQYVSKSYYRDYDDFDADFIKKTEKYIRELSESLLDFAADPSSIKSSDRINFNKEVGYIKDYIEETISRCNKEMGEIYTRWLDGIVKTSERYVLKPPANERFENEVKELSERYKSKGEYYENDYVKQGLRDAFEQEKAVLDNQRKKDNIVETARDFKDLLLNSISDYTEYPPEIESKREDYKQTIKTFAERIKDAFNKTPDENVVLELESTLGQFDDFIKDAPVDDAKKNIAKNIVNSIREQIKDAYKDISVDAVRSVISRVNGQNEGILKLDDIKEDSIKDNDSSFDIEQLKEACKVLKEVQDTINDIAKSMKAMLNDVLELAKQASASTKGGLGGDELSMTLDDTSESVSKLRMNLQLLSDDSESSDNYVDKLRKEIDAIYENISKQIDKGFKSFDKECEEKIRNSFNNLSDAIDQGARAIEAIIQKYGSNPIGEGKFDKESHSKVYSARENLEEKYKDFKNVTSPPHMGYYIDKDFEQETDDTVQSALKALNDKMNALEKSPSLIHADTVGESALKLIEKFTSIVGDEEFTAKYKNRTTFNKLLDSIEKNIDNISEDDIPKHLEEDWKNLREAIGYIRKNKDTVFKPMADDIFKEQKDKIDQMKVDIDDSYGSEAIRKGLNDTLRKLEDKLDKERRINKSKETVDEFDREIIKPLESEINKSSASSNVKQDYSQAINGIVERMKRAFDKATPKDIILEFEAAFKQLEDRMNNAPVRKVTEDNIKHIINRMREQIENAYEASNLDLEVNLPVRSSLDVPAVINSIREQMDDVEQYVENNVNLPIRSSLDVPDIRRNLDVIEVEFREVGEAAESFRDKIKSVFAVFGQKNSHVATHMVGEFNNKLNKLKENAKKVSASIKDIGTPFKKAFSGLSGIINKIISPIKKVTSGFKGMGNEAKVASSKVNGLTGSFKGLLSKLTMYFGIYEIFNLFKTGTQDAMSYEATIMNLQRTFGKASQSLIDFANTNAVAFGLSKRQVAEYGNIYSAIMRDVNMAMAKPGDSADDIAKKTMGMSEELLKSAGIISSALGYDMEYVLEGLRSGLLGSSQAVDQFGLNLKRANLESSQAFKEVANGAESWEKLTVAQQQYVITQEIINQTTSKFGSILDRNGKIMQSTASLHSQFLAQLANTKLAVGNLGKVIWTAILPPLTKILAVLEVVFNYAASAMTALLKMFGIKVDLNANLGGTDKLNESLNNLGDSTSTTDELGDSLNNVGDSAQDTAKDTEEAAKKIKRALAGFDQINVLTLGEDAENEEPEFEGFDPDNWNPTPVDPGDFGVQLPDLSDEFKDKLKKLKELFDEFIEPLKAAWDELGDRWIAAWDRLKASFKNFCDALSDFLVSVWNNGGKEFVQHMAEIVLAVGIAAMEIGGTILDSLAKLWKHLDPSTNINTKGLLDALNEVSVKIRDLLLDLNGHFESLMNNGGQDVLNALGDMFMNLGEAAVRGVGIVIDAIDGLLDHLDPATNKKTQGALGGLEYLFKSIGQFALGLTDAFATFMDNGGQEFLNNMGDIVMILIDMAATITGDLLNAITAFFDSWAGHVVITVVGRALELVSSILKGLLEILEPLTPIISGVVAAIGAFMVASKITTAVTTIVSAFQNLGPILGIVKAGLSALWAVLAANPVAALVAAIVGIGVLLVALYNKCEGFREVVDNILGAFSGLFDALKETFSNILEDVTNIFQDVIDIIVGIFTGDGEKVGEAVRSLVGNILDLLWDLVTGVVDIGWNLITGLVEGIWEGIKAIPQLLAGIGEFVIDFFKGLFGIHSPSTVFAELGGYLIEGLIQGISDSVPSLGDIFNGVSDAISGAWDKVEKAWDGASDFFSGIGETVKGVLDTIKNTSIPKPKIEWDKVKESASKIVDNIKTTVEKFKADLPKPKVSWNDLTTSLSKILDNLRRTISNFKWELPKPKLPKFSVTGGQAPWGFMGKGSMPKIDIKWFKTGGIMTSATLFGMSGNTLLGGGEAGAEAILPLDELWSRLDNHFNQQNALLRSTVANSNGNNSNRPVNIVLKVNDIEMGKAVVSSLKALSNHSGTLDLPLK